MANCRLMGVGLLLVVWALRLQAQPAVPRAETDRAGNIDSLRFLALEELERKEKLLEIRKRLLNESSTREVRIREVESAARRFEEMANESTDDDRILAAMRLRRLTRDTVQELGADRLRRLEIMDLIRAAATDAGISAVGLDYLRQAKKIVEDMLAEQGRQEKQLRTVDKAVAVRVSRIPPPDRFTAASGLTMALAARDAGGIYLQTRPVSVSQYRTFLEAFPGVAMAEAELERLAGSAGDVPVSHVTWTLAAAYCRWLSDAEKSFYRLPTVAECEILAEAGDAVEHLGWTSTDWEPPDRQDVRMAERFGVRMYCLWDPGRSLKAAGRAVPELPFAAYPTRLRVVTAVATGRRQRWNRLRKVDRADHAGKTPEPTTETGDGDAN